MYLILTARAGNKERQHLAKVKVASQNFRNRSSLNSVSLSDIIIKNYKTKTFGSISNKRRQNLSFCSYEKQKEYLKCIIQKVTTNGMKTKKKKTLNKNLLI